MKKKHKIKLRACLLAHLMVNLIPQYEQYGWKVECVRPIIWWKDFDIINEHVAIMSKTCGETE